MKTELRNFFIRLPLVHDFYKQRLTKRLEAKEQQRAKNLEAWEKLPWGDSKMILHTLADQTQIYLFKDSLLCQMIFDGHFEDNELDFVKLHLKPGDTFIDIGSNIGLFSLVASQKVGSSGKVIAFEPSPATFNKLKLNTSLSKFGNIEVRNLGLSDSISTLTLNILGSGYDAWDTFSPVDQSKLLNTVQVPVSTLDDQLSDVDKGKISMVKIDVEGWEKFVLLGGESFLKSYSPFLLVEFTESNTKAAGYEITQIYDLLVSWGYEWFTFSKGKLVPSPKKESYPYENLVAKKKKV